MNGNIVTRGRISQVYFIVFLYFSLTIKNKHIIFMLERRSKMNQPKTVSVLVPAPLYDSIQKIADQLGVRKSTIVRKAITLGLNKTYDAIRKEQEQMSI